LDSRVSWDQTELRTSGRLMSKTVEVTLGEENGMKNAVRHIKMKKEVFESEAFLSLAEEHLVLVRADFPRSKKNQLSKEQTKHNESLAEKYNPEGKFPFTLLLDSTGKVLKKWDGYVFSSQDSFMADLKNTIVSGQK
jgi:hypothetical protein